ncbi:MAG: caspase family protein [Deltaproteobacteria bacterium]|nr:caspase family protein [Deltaproteobacteria bacterium]
MRFSLACTLVLCAWALPAQAGARRPGYAIIIGNNAPPAEDPQLSPLGFADDDAVRYREVLGRLVGEVHLLTVLDAQTQRQNPGLAASTQPPTLEALRAAVASVQAGLREAPGPVYLVFSGHGSSDASGEPFLALLDRALTRAVLFEEILPALDAPAVHLIIDACNAGAMVGARGPLDEAGEAVSVPVAEATRAAVVERRSLARFPSVGAIIATSAGQQAHEWSRIEAGVFTHELLSGLLGPADINGDLRVEYSEVQAFVGASNSRITDPRARPDVQAIPPARDHRMPLVALDALPGPFLRGKVGRLGHFFIELAGGRRYLDANLGAGQVATILLPWERQAYLRTSDGEAELPPSDGGVVDLDDLSFRTVRLASRGSLDTALRQELFAAPYDMAYYRGFVDSRALVPVDLAVEAVDPLALRWTWKEKAAVGLWSASAAAVVSAIVTGIAAAHTKAQFEETTLQQPAMELAARYDRLRVATWVGAAVAAAAAGGGTALWISARPSNDEGPGAVVGISGKF